MDKIAEIAGTDPEYHLIDLFRLECQGGRDIDRARRAAIYVANEIAEALRTQHLNGE